eukprot:gene7867-5494_t
MMYLEFYIYIKNLLNLGSVSYAMYHNYVYSDSFTEVSTYLCVTGNSIYICIIISYTY